MPPRATAADLRALMATARPRVVGIVHRAVGCDEGVADDAVQLAYEHTARVLADPEKRPVDPGKLLGYLLRAAIREAVRIAEVRAARDGDLPDDLAAPLPEEDDRLTRLVDCVGKLPAHLRTLIERRYWERVPQKQMAREAGRAESSVSTAHKRALELLRRCIDDGGGVR